jgi:hypothetical protein
MVDINPGWKVSFRCQRLTCRAVDATLSVAPASSRQYLIVKQANSIVLWIVDISCPIFEKVL